jgi:NAD+ kinase
MKIKYRHSKDKRCEDINSLIKNHFPHMLEEKNPDLILVSGGDGAMLHAIQEYNHYKVPFFGYGVGTLNFMMNEIPLDKFKKKLVKIENDQMKLGVLKTKKIKTSISKSNGKIIEVGQAVNEVVLGSKLMGYHNFSITTCDGSFNDFEIQGTGICVSTDLGSTGYNFNLGGAILPLGSDMWSILGIVCNRYLEDILNTTEISIENKSKKSKPSFYLDGIKQKATLSRGDKLILKKGDMVKISFINQKKFLEKRIDISSRYRKC